MNIIAKADSVRISPRKLRLVADSVRNLSLEEALKVLSIIKKRGSSDLEKTIKSAIANAINNKNLQRENLFIKKIDILDGPAFKRYHPSTRGRTHPYKKRTSHITVVLTDNKLETPFDPAQGKRNPKLPSTPLRAGEANTKSEIQNSKTEIKEKKENSK